MILKDVENISHVFRHINFEPKNIFDLGANVGQFTIDFARTFTHAHVFSFEPIANTFKELEQNVVSSQIGPRIHLYNFGLSDEKKTMNLGKPRDRKDRDSNSGLYSSYYSREGDFDIKECKFVNLNEFCNDNNVYPDLIKMDIEGHEFEVLNTIKGDTLQAATAILVEVNCDERFPDPTDVATLLVSSGFESVYPPLDFVPPPSTRNPKRLKAFNRLWLRTDKFIVRK